MDTIAIEVIAVAGKLVGVSESDRWNLRMLGLHDLVDDGRSQASLKRARRMLSREFGTAFTLTKSRAPDIALPSPAEVEALGVALASAA